MSATAPPIFPKPTMPIVLPESSVSGFFQKQKSGQFDHSPFFTASECRATPTASSEINANTSCATPMVE